jgi:mRNA interferase MazF
MRRGSVVTVALRGDAGKPRPALVVQADELFADLRTVVILPLTSDIADRPLVRVTMNPTDDNGLREPSQVMLSRPQFTLRDKIGEIIGRAEAPTMLEVGRKLALLLGLAG